MIIKTQTVYLNPLGLYSPPFVAVKDNCVGQVAASFCGYLTFPDHTPASGNHKNTWQPDLQFSPYLNTPAACGGVIDYL